MFDRNSLLDAPALEWPEYVRMIYGRPRPPAVFSVITEREAFMTVNKRKSRRNDHGPGQQAGTLVQVPPDGDGVGPPDGNWSSCRSLISAERRFSTFECAGRRSRISLQSGRQYSPPFTERGSASAEKWLGQSDPGGPRLGVDGRRSGSGRKGHTPSTRRSAVRAAGRAPTPNPAYAQERRQS